ncbi:MAG TPA: hypothetical protein VLG92_00195 [Candidatus Saccharimonadia bacterium]|nr:hypothetical protein [Candidatus Saccharimonadia bacterium]
MSPEDFTDGSSQDHPELTNPKEALPPSEELKERLHQHGVAAAKSGHMYESDNDEGRIGYSKKSQVPDTAADSLTVTAYDKPLTDKGLEGLVMRVVHREAIGTPDLYEDAGEMEEVYSQHTTMYDFFQVPDGLHVDKTIKHRPKPSEEAPSAPMPQTSLEWELVMAALDKAKAMESDNAAFEREMGLRFCSEKDAEDLDMLMAKTWPQGADT